MSPFSPHSPETTVKISHFSRLTTSTALLTRYNSWNTPRLSTWKVGSGVQEARSRLDCQRGWCLSHLPFSTGKGHGLSITPLPAGHMIGGTIWKIVKDGEEEIVYAVDFNHKREMWAFVRGGICLFLFFSNLSPVIFTETGSSSSFFSFFIPLSHLNGCTLESISRPSLLITDSFNAAYVQPRRKQRDEMLLSKSPSSVRTVSSMPLCQNDDCNS